MKQKHEYALYDTKDNDLLVGIMTTQEAMEFTNLSRQSIYTGVTCKTLLKNRYRVVSLGKMEDMND